MRPLALGLIAVLSAGAGAAITALLGSRLLAVLSAAGIVMVVTLAAAAYGRSADVGGGTLWAYLVLGLAVAVAGAALGAAAVRRRGPDGGS